MKIFAVKDMKAGIWLAPNSSRSVADATRQFTKIANEQNNMFSDFPHDYRLFHIADFDMEHGVISTLKHPADLGAAADFKFKPEENTLPFPKAAQ